MPVPDQLCATAVDVTVSDRNVLEALDVALTPGRILAVVGPNGAGKSSLVRVLSGEWRPTRGSVALDDVALQTWQPRALAQRLAVLPQHTSLEFEFTGAEVAMLGRIPHATGRSRDEAIVAETLAAVDASALADRLYPQLSGGEKQRLQLSRVLSQIWSATDEQTRFLLLDEPAAALDLAHVAMLTAVLRRVASDGVGVLLVVHDLNLALRVADDILMLRAARTVAHGAIETLLDRDVIHAVFDVDVAIVRENGDRPVVVVKS